MRISTWKILAVIGEVNCALVKGAVASRVRKEPGTTAVVSEPVRYLSCAVPKRYHSWPEIRQCVKVRFSPRSIVSVQGPELRFGPEKSIALPIRSASVPSNAYERSHRSYVAQ